MFLISIFTNLYAGIIQGRVMDEKSGEPLPGSNIVVIGLNIGAATDLNGEFNIRKVPVGENTIAVSFIGYEQIRKVINVKVDEPTIVEIYLSTVNLMGEEVIVTGQAKGQLDAINKQLAASTLSSQVSSARIQELPDANAAESVGRLPSVSISRNGGEGSKVTIRGMSAEHNKISIDGIEMAATDPNNRSVDISMISPYMLAGIEVQKAITAAQDGDAMGGVVDFKIREASSGLNFDIITQGMHNGLRNELGDYKLVGAIDNRFFDDKLGILIQADTEKRMRDSESLTADYYMKGFSLDTINTTYVNDVELEDIYRTKERLGGAYVMDYKLPFTKLKFVNFYSKIGINTESYSEQVQVQGTGIGLGHRSGVCEQELSLMTNSLELDQNFNSGNLNLKISRSESVHDTPKDATWNFRNRSGIQTDGKFQTDPAKVFDYVVRDNNAEYLQLINFYDDYNKESIWSYKLDYEYDYALSKNITGKLIVGGKYKHKSRKYDHNESYIEAYLGSTTETKNFISDYFRLGIAEGTRDMPLPPFLSDDYDNDNFLDGDFEIGPFPDIDILNDLAEMVNDSGFPDVVYDSQQLIPADLTSKRDDYKGDEYYSAGYIMTEMKLGSKWIFSPGLRYERNVTKYKGVRGDATTGGLPMRNWQLHHDTTDTRHNDFLLPMVHLKYMPVDWLDVRLAYTETISRPDYSAIIPKITITKDDITYGNINLDPSYSRNYDVNVAFHGSKIGLVTVGGFYKDISNQLFSPGGRIVRDSADVYENFPGLDEFNITKSIGNEITTTINNGNNGTVYGLEFDWQSSFWYLPGLLKGLVFNFNYTHIFSETKYPQTIVKVEYTPWPVITNEETFYKTRLISQPDDILNMAVGYDFKGFSGRLSMIYKSNIFTEDNFWQEMRANTGDYLRWDFSMKQELPFDGLEATLNITNLNNEKDLDINQVLNEPVHREQYGRNIIFGLRYRF